MIAGAVRRIEGSTDLLVCIGSNSDNAIRVKPGDVVRVDEARLPLPHAANHLAVGSDPIAVTDAEVADGANIALLKLEPIAAGSVVANGTAVDPNQPHAATNDGTLRLTDTAIGRAAITGDVSVPTSSNVATIANDAVTFAKMANLATDNLIGRATAGTGDPELVSCTAAGRALLDDANAAAQRATLGLVIATDIQPQMSEKESEWFWDLDGGFGDWLTYQTGTGAAIYNSATDHIGGSLHADGEWGFGTGTTATGAAACYRAPFTAFGGGTAYEFEARITNGALSTSGEEFALQIGFGDGINAVGQPVDGAYFVYRRDVDGDFWVAVTRSNSTETKTVTSVAPAGYSAMTIFRIDVDSVGTSVAFKINGTTVATHTTNIPTGSSRTLGVGMKLEKKNGTTARYAYADWFRLRKTRSTAR